MIQNYASLCVHFGQACCNRQRRKLEVTQIEREKKVSQKLSHTHHATHTHYVSSESVWEMRIIWGTHGEKSLFIFTFCFSVIDSEVSLSVITTTQNFTLMVPLCLVSNTKCIFFPLPLVFATVQVLYHALSKNCSIRKD